MSRVEFEALPEEEQAAISRYFPSSAKMVRTKNDGFQIGSSFLKYADIIYDFPLNEKDVWIVTFPKSGTTWTQEQIWLLANNINFEDARDNLNNRFPFIEMAGLPSEHGTKMWQESARGFNSTAHLNIWRPIEPQQIIAMPSPRFIKSHLPFYLLPPKLLETCKVVYVARNPKDVCVSWYYHHKLIKFQGLDATFDQFVELFLTDKLLYSPYWPQVKAAWERRHHPNFLFLFYEDMKTDLMGQLRKIAKFLGKQYSDEDYHRLKNHLIIDNFKENPSVNPRDNKKIGLFNEDGDFVRKGKTGDWRNHFSPEINAKFDKWIENNSKDTDLRFKYELDVQD